MNLRPFLVLADRTNRSVVERLDLQRVKGDQASQHRRGKQCAVQQLSLQEKNRDPRHSGLEPIVEQLLRCVQLHGLVDGITEG